MSSSWGINRTMAQIHALLLITGEPLSVDEIIDRLHISRGNASMNPVSYTHLRAHETYLLIAYAVFCLK